MKTLFTLCIGIICCSLFFFAGNIETQALELKDLLKENNGEITNVPKLPSGTSSSAVNTGIAKIIEMILYLIGGLSVIMIVIGGFRYVASFGNDTLQEGAKKTILYAVMGLVAVILSYAIVSNIITLLYSSK